MLLAAGVLPLITLQGTPGVAGAFTAPQPIRPGLAVITVIPTSAPQDEATSTVWGMPGSIAKAGLAQAILPLAEIGPALRNLLTGQGA